MLSTTVPESYWAGEAAAIHIEPVEISKQKRNVFTAGLVICERRRGERRWLLRQIPEQIQSARRISEPVNGHAEKIQQRQVQIRHWSVFGMQHVTPAANEAFGSRQQGREIVVIVNVGIADRSAVHDRSVIQQSSIAVGRGL
jgi:hypothetical protein